MIAHGVSEWSVSRADRLEPHPACRTDNDRRACVVRVVQADSIRISNLRAFPKPLKP